MKSLFFVLLSALAGCNTAGRAGPEGEARSLESADRTHDAQSRAVEPHHASHALVPDAGRAAVPAILEKIQVAVPSLNAREWKGSGGKREHKQRLARLAKDLKAPALARASHLEEWILSKQTDRGVLHLGLIRLHFDSCKDLSQAVKEIGAVGRMNFLLPALTVFRYRPIDHALVFAFSETPLHPDLVALFDGLDHAIGRDSPCASEGK